MANAFLHGNGGGGAALNFRVVGGTTVPENPKENTIWVNTDAEITSYVFSATEPETPVEGMVLIFTGSASAIEFNALKKNGIQVYPLSAKQYVSGAWVEKTAKIYQGGVWVNWITYMIEKGIDNTTITGGWSAKAIAINGGGGGHEGRAPTITKSDGYIKFAEPAYTASALSGLAHTNNKIDLSGVSKIKIHASGWYNSGVTYCTAAVSVWSALGSAATTNRVANVVISSLQEYVLDVSNLTGEHYIGVTLVNTMDGKQSYVNIYDLSFG